MTEGRVGDGPVVVQVKVTNAAEVHVVLDGEGTVYTVLERAADRAWGYALRHLLRFATH